MKWVALCRGWAAAATIWEQVYRAWFCSAVDYERSHCTRSWICPDWMTWMTVAARSGDDAVRWLSSGTGTMPTDVAAVCCDRAPRVACQPCRRHFQLCGWMMLAPSEHDDLGYGWRSARKSQCDWPLHQPLWGQTEARSRQDHNKSTVIWNWVKWNSINVVASMGASFQSWSCFNTQLNDCGWFVVMLDRLNEC